MRRHRFIGNFDLLKKKLRIDDKELVSQIRNVLRLKPGDEVLLADGKLNEARARIVNLKNDFLEVEIEEVFKNENEPKTNVILYCSILKRENFELVVQKATEIGVKEITPLLCARTVKLDFKHERLEKIIKEAAEQSGRGIVPTLCKPAKLEDALRSAEKNDLNVFFDAGGAKPDQKEFTWAKKIGVFVGPEGGWDPEEIELAKRHACKILNLGKLTLRAETAAIIASYIPRLLNS